MRLFCCCLCLLFAAAAATPAPAQGFSIFNNRNHPELRWQVAETEHFEIVYPQRIAGIEAEAAAVAEASYSVLSELMGVDFEGDKIRVFLSDEDEIANGVAYPIGRAGYTAIWVHVNDTAEIWTGDVKWMRKVLAHELVHLFHYRAVRSNIGLLQELFARPLPRAWTEGLAQYLTERWDAQRGDRYLRTAVLEGRLSPDDGLSPDAGRLLYATGNSQVRRMAELYGDSTIAAILAHRSRPVFGIQTHDFYNAFEKVTGDRFSDFQEEWEKHVGIYYHTLAGQTERLDSLRADPLPLPGQRIDDVQFSPDTSRVAALVLSSLARPVRRLYVMENAVADTSDNPDNAPDGRAPRRLRALKVLAEGSIEAPFAWGPQGDRIAYSRSVRGRHGSILSDLFVVDVGTGKKRRLTTNRRAHTPTFSPDGRRLAFVGMDGKTANVFLLDLATGDERQLTTFTGDVQITAARWQPPEVQGGRVEGRTGGRGEAVGEGTNLVPGSTDRAGAIAIALFDAAGERTVSLVDAETGAVQPLTDRLHDDRLPVWNPAGDALAFTSLRDDAPNVFRTAVLGGAPTGAARVTQLFGGARVQGWLPPDSTYPSGRLLLVASETKRRDRAFLVDAGRVPRVLDRTPEAPLAYSSWTRHRPPSTIPDQIAPDARLVAARRAYRPLRNLTHVVSIAFPYYDNPDDYGLVGSTTWVEPLNKHSIALFAGLSLPSPVDESFGFLSYTNNTLAPSVTLNLYRAPGTAQLLRLRSARRRPGRRRRGSGVAARLDRPPVHRHQRRAPPPPRPRRALRRRLLRPRDRDRRAAAPRGRHALRRARRADVPAAPAVPLQRRVSAGRDGPARARHRRHPRAGRHPVRPPRRAGVPGAAAALWPALHLWPRHRRFRHAARAGRGRPRALRHLRLPDPVRRQRGSGRRRARARLPAPADRRARGVRQRRVALSARARLCKPPCSAPSASAASCRRSSWTPRPCGTAPISATPSTAWGWAWRSKTSSTCSASRSATPWGWARAGTR